MLVFSDEHGDESKEVRHLLLSLLGSDEKQERMEVRFGTLCPVVTPPSVGDRRTRAQSISQGMPL